MTRKILAAAAAMIATVAAAQDRQTANQDFAQTLWTALDEARMVGDGAIRTHPYEGVEPHGAILEFLADEIEVEGREATAIVKRNYSSDATIEGVWADGREQLASITVMFQREAGYDPEHGDWFWAKYLPDGSLDQSPEGMALAGQVPGCIQCHEGAPGGDYIFSYDR